MPVLNKTPGGISPAGTDLGLGTMLTDQVVGETEEQRKKRMQEQQQQAMGASPAALSLFGGMGAGTRANA